MTKNETPTLLLVDDTPGVLLALETVLRTLHCQVTTAQSGQEALRLLEKQDYDLYLLDVQLPDIDGLALAKHLAEKMQSQYVPVIFMTELNAEQQERFEGYGLEEMDCLIKPVAPQELKEKVQNFLQMYLQKTSLETQAVALAYMIQQLQKKFSICQQLCQGVLPRKLRIPLHAMLGLINALKRGDYGHVTEKQENILQQVEQSGHQLLDMIRNLTPIIPKAPEKHESEQQGVPARPKVPEQKPPVPSSVHPSQKLILLVEDNQINAATLIHSFKSYGYNIIHVSTGTEAVEITRKEHPDVIILDIQLPEMNGLEVTRHIRADTQLRNIPIIALTAVAMPGDRERCLEAGVNVYLSKPVSFKELLNMINSQW